MISNLRKENESLRENIDRINENFQDIMALYEVVSNQINPFIGVSKITATSMEKLEKLEHETEILRKRIDELQRDLMIIVDTYLKQYDIDINKIIDEILAEEEISKAMSEEEDIHD